MPASRPPARSAFAPSHSMVAAGSGSPEAHFVPVSPARGSGDLTATPSSPSVKKRRTPNAFFLFRSYMIANKLYPPELKHQNELSCYVAEKWRAASLEYRAAFFRMAEEEKQRNELEGPTDRKATARKKTRKVKQRRTAADQEQSRQASSQSHVSDLDIPVPVLKSFTPPDHPPVFHAAPQPVHPIPTSLLQWGHEMEDEWHDGAIETDPFAFQVSSLSGQYVRPGPSHCDPSHPMALDAAVQSQLDFGLSPQMDIPWPTEVALGDANNTFSCPPSFGTYLPW